MAGPRSSLEGLELTGEEVERLTKAFQDEGFRALFAEYAAELADPEQRAIYEAEVAALERQRGVEARFLHPSPGWVLRTSQGGTGRCYLNLCANPLVGRPEARPEPGGGGGGGGCWWSLPHCLAPGREELSRRHPRGPRRLVYDVVFHPDTLRLAARSARFRRLVQDTALEAVEKHFSPGLDRANAVPLRGVKYKGVPQATLLRTPLPGGAPPPEGGDGEEGEGGGGAPLPPFPTPYAYPPPEPERETQPRSRPQPPPAAAAAATPRWTLRHRSYVDLQDYRHSRDSAPSPVPRELVVSVELPLLSSAAQAQLEIHGQELRLDSQRPAAYRLRLRLPYPVDEGGGRATFNKAEKQLVVVLPVLAKPEPGPFPYGQDDSQERREAGEEDDVEMKGEEGGGTPAGNGLPSPHEQQEESLAVPAEDNGLLAQDPCQTEPPPVLHVGESSAARPVSAVQMDPAAPIVPDSSGSAPHLPVGPACQSPEPPACSGEEMRARASDFRVAAAPECHEAPSPGLPPRATMSSDEGARAKGEGAAWDSHAPSVCSGGGTVERPEQPGGGGIPCPVTALSQPPLPECSAVTRVVPPSGPSGLAAAAAPGCDIGSEGPAVTSPASPISSLLGQSEGPLPSTGPPVPSPACPTSLVLPAGCLGTGTSPSLPAADLDIDPEAPLNSPRCLASPAPLRCPPFHCTQDERALTLLLEVPGILPQSLKGEVGTNNYRVRFAAQDSASYSFLLQFLPENKLTPQEMEVNVSPSNAVIILAKSAESTGLWTKMYFGPNADRLQESWFVTENNVAKFLGHLPQPPSSGPPEMEQCPLIEVLDVSEGQSLIRLQASDHNRFQPDPAEPWREDNEAPENGSKLSADVENGPVQSTDSLPARETMGRVGQGPDYCLVPDPHDPRSAVPEKLPTCQSNESEQTSTASQEAVSVTPARFHWKEPAQTSEVEAVHSEPTQSKQGLASTPVPPVIKETNMQDGSVEHISHHATHCPITFQNSLLYELD